MDDSKTRRNAKRLLQDVQFLRWVLAMTLAAVVYLVVYPRCSTYNVDTSSNSQGSDMFDMSFKVTLPAGDGEVVVADVNEQGDDKSVSEDLRKQEIEERTEQVEQDEAFSSSSDDIPTIDVDTQVFMGHRLTNTGWIVDTRCFNKKLGRKLIGYGVGCGEDVSWDVGMAQRYGFDMFLYDPTPKSIAYVTKVQKRYPNKIKFTPEGLAAKEGILTFTKPQMNSHVSMRVGVHSKDPKKILTLKVNTLKNWMQKNNHTYLDVFKIDIEGSEYDVLEQFIELQWFPFTQLLIEFHQRWFSDGFNNPRHQAILKGLKDAGFVAYAKRHGNQEISYIKSQDLGYCVNGGPDVRQAYH